MDPTDFDEQDVGGLDRRSVLRRGAVLGGALVWTVPAVQSIAGPAFAAGTDCPPQLVVFLDTNGNGKQDPGEECLYVAPFVNGDAPGADCCGCYDSPADIDNCIARGQCKPGALTAC